ncbi:MAG: nucleotidyltransferase family protein [Sphingobacteriaceae bacterium]|nr:nucleotidyltransferase family protein [Sphingobacteriaceae bacterium]
MTGLIILAAGSSSRLGQPKQMLIYKGKSLLRHAVEEGIVSECSPIVVVLGSNESGSREEINSCPVQIVVNHNWEHGMSSSIKCGIEALLQNQPDVSEAIIMLCDQPFVDAGILNKLISKKHLIGKAIAACRYDNTLGTPALFDRGFFSQLLSLEGQQGAKKLLLSHSEHVEPVPFPLGNIDIDTLDDYEKLTNNS